MKPIEYQVDEYLNYCERVRRMTETTMRAKQNVLERFVRVVGIEDLAELTNEVFNKWVAYETTRGACARSVNTYNSVVIAMVKYYRGTGMQIPLNITLVCFRFRSATVHRQFPGGCPGMPLRFFCADLCG